MQIVIDTQKDSKEDIRKAAAFLSSLSDGSKKHHSNIFESSGSSLDMQGSDSSSFSGQQSSSSSSEGNAFASMFGGMDQGNDVDKGSSIVEDSVDDSLGYDIKDSVNNEDDDKEDENKGAMPQILPY